MGCASDRSRRERCNNLHRAFQMQEERAALLRFVLREVKSRRKSSPMLFMLYKSSGRFMAMKGRNDRMKIRRIASALLALTL